MGWFDPPKCPGCGTVRQPRFDTYIQNDYEIERMWDACPFYWLAESSEDRARHLAVWRRGKVRPLVAADG